MFKGESMNLKSMQKYGQHSYIALGVDKQFQMPKVGSNLKQNYDLSITIDTESVLNPIELINNVLGYKGVDIAITDTIEHIGKSVNIFKYEIQGDFLIVNLGKRGHRLAPNELYEHLTDIYFNIDSMENQKYEIYKKKVIDFYAHKELNRNIFVTDNPEFHSIKLELIKDRSMMIIESKKLIPVIECIERHFGNYYLKPRSTVSKGLYYRNLLYKKLPNYEKTWVTAVNGVYKGNLDNQIFDFSKSLGDRCMSLLEVLCEIKYLYLESPNNESEWSLVNKLNYFAILFTGILDNLAHLTVCIYTKSFSPMQKVLKVPLVKGQKKANKFQEHIKEENKHLWNLIENFQDILEIIYPIRDSVQHRGFLSGATIDHLNENWIKIMIKVEDSVGSAIKKVDEVQYQKMNSWGLYLIDKDCQYLEPFTFAKKATEEIFQFINEYLNILDIPGLLNENSPN